MPRLTGLLLALVLSLLTALNGCGGGSGDGTASTSSTSTTSTATTGTAPAISTQPVAQSALVGASVSFSVVASGSATLSYQWRKNGSSIAGATAATYTIARVTSGDAGSYDVVVSNSAGSITSSAAALSVSTASGAPTITTQPVAQSVVAGANVSFSVVASSGSTMSYQWRKDGTAVSGATASSYSLSAVTASDAGRYDVVVTNSSGSTTSSAATLTVTTASSSGSFSSNVTSAAQSFLATLSSAQQSSAQLAWSLTTARHWSNLPAAMVSRNGVAWSSLSSTQQAAARSMITTALGSTGNAMHLGWQMADNYLYANGGGSSYGEGQYYVAMLGTPSTSSFWLLQLTGHHLTINLALNGTYKAPTPVFMGIEPKGSFTYNGTTYDPMGTVRNAWSSLGAVLVTYSGAKLSGTYSDLLFGANGSGNIDGSCPRSYSSVTTHGLLYSSLSAADQALARAVIQAYIDSQASEVASELTTAYLSDTALASTYVAYAGSGTVSTKGNYFRIEGPRLWAEVSVQQGVIFNSDIHYHGVWRDKVGDYGGQCVG